MRLFKDPTLIAPRFSGVALALTAATVILFTPHASYAADTFGKLICNTMLQMNGNGSTTKSVIGLLSVAAYISGILTMASGLLKLKEFAENPSGRTPLHQPVMRLIGAAFLLALPIAAHTVIYSIFAAPGGGGINTCTPESAGMGGATDPGTMVANFVKNIRNPMTYLVSFMGYFLGILLMFRGFLKLSKFGTDPNAYSMPKILANLIVGGLIFSLGATSSAMMQTIFGTAAITASSSVTSWSALGGADASTKTAVEYSLVFVQIVGMISFLRGWLIVKSAAEGSGQATMAQGFTHVIGGTLCLNIFYVLKALDATMGTSLTS